MEASPGEVDPTTGVPIEDLMVSAATVGTLYDPATDDPSQPEEVADVDLQERGTPVMMGQHKVNFDSDKEVSELGKGIAAAILNKARKLGMEPSGKRTEGSATTIVSIGGVAIPEEHGNSREDADSYLENRARESG
ncbi:MAG: hypothetical protein DRQ40_00765 [Gammaproteobacteria bacterium]|nr:MAG: hypothetical protein DRQ40_00765 [Gammaproteobacteria bacterium]